MRYPSIVIAALVAALFAGCASVGTEMNLAQVSQIKKGVTTRAQVEQLFGKPMSVSLMPDGKVMALWFYTKASSNAENFIPVVNLVQTKIDTQTQTLQVYFDASGVVENFTTNEASSAVKAGLAN
jgi:outer membrane protein assembly factor BamE (lipoprotein component of BamABCDE complex)